MYPQDFKYGGISLRADNKIPLDFTEWIDRCLEGTITAEQFALLDSEIATNEYACAYYLEFITTYVGLMDLQGVLPKTFDIPWHDILFHAAEQQTSKVTGHTDLYHFGPDVTEEEKRRQIEIYASEQLDAYLKEQHAAITRQESPESGGDILDTLDNTAKTVIAFFRTGLKAVKAAAACLLVILLLLLTFVYFYRMFVPREIATLSKSLNAKLSDNETIVSGMRLTNRRDLSFLHTGLIEILFDGGAKVLLEAPAAFRLNSSDRMVLHQGQLFAVVPDYAQGFTVETPNSQIIDMGTEFAIRVEQNGTSDLHMFKGKAILASDSMSEVKQTLTLTAGHAKRIDNTGYISDIVIKEQAFVRNFYKDTGFVWRGQKLSLVDIVGNGNGLGSGQTNIYVDPIEGYKDSIYCNGKGNWYHMLQANPFVDGLFIPNGNNKQIVSSQAHEFTDCPGTNGECYTTVGANPKQGVWATDMRNGIIQFNGKEYGNQKHPCLMMHANLGITFDLNAVRALCPDIKMVRFVSQYGVADFEEQSGCNADFWLLIDGQVRQSKRNVTTKGVLSNVSIELGPSDRFLTLVTTDGGDIDRMGAYQRAYTCDWCVFVEPALILETEEGTDNMQIK